MGNDKESTKRVRTSDLNKKTRRKTKSPKGSKPKKLKFKDKHPKASKAIKIGLLLFVLLAIIGAGILVGAFVGIFGDELKIDEASLVVGYENSTVYDADGNLIATLSGGTKRKSISLSEMSEYLPKAYVAIEDERFYNHSGIDIGRTVYATVTYILHGGKSSFGGSTITQQVIKNITQDKDKTALAGVMRKIKEISKAIQVEHYLSKDQILELYLNLIFVGGDDINGVELGSIYYFNKSAKDLSIAECAYLAGINNSPNAYRPFAEYADSENPEAKKQEMKDKINKRTKTVLAKMEECGYITEDQKNEAIAEVDKGLNFQKGDEASVTTEVSYHTEAAIDQILDQIQAETDMNRDMAEMYLYSSGLKIYTTQKTDIQTVLEEEIVKADYVKSSTYKADNKETGESETVTQYAIPTMVIEDHKTGQVVACATATGSKEERTAKTKLGYLNYPTSIKKQTGSSMKPIAVIAPGLESGKITGATVFDDVPTSWGSGANAWNPKNDGNQYRGLINMRTAIGVSANIPHAKALTVIGTPTAVEFCESVGLPNFEAEGMSLALGGLQDGVSPAHMAAAYSAIANGGLYITPTFYTKVTDAAGKVLYEPNQEERRVMSEANAYLEKEILTEPVKTGTATYCAIPGIETSAKTGTTNKSFDRWLCGFTPYYTASCWYGYVFSSEVKGFSRNPAGQIWDNVMTTIHKDLPNAEYEKPEGVIQASVCRVTGKLASEACGGNVYTEYFTNDNVPKERCGGHTGVTMCVDTGYLATPGCPNQAAVYTNLPEYEANAPWSSDHTSAVANVIGEYCPSHGGMGGGGTSYVTAEDQAGFQAATEADAMGLTGQAREDYINNAKNQAKQPKPQPAPQTPPSQPSTQKPENKVEEPKPSTDPNPTQPGNGSGGNSGSSDNSGGNQGGSGQGGSQDGGNSNPSGGEQQPAQPTQPTDGEEQTP